MSTELVDPMASVRAYLAAETSASTRRAYRADLADFADWCGRACETALPATPVSVAKYIAALADRGLTVATINRRLAAIRYAHRKANFEPPTSAEGVKATLRGIRRSIGVKVNRKAPATAAVLLTALDRLSGSLIHLRDRALLLVGFAAALRRSELVALNFDDVAIHPAGMVLQIRRSKTDQAGEGAELPVPRGNALKPVDALEAWLQAAAITEGPVFREVDRHGNVGTRALSDRSVARIVKRILKAAGLDPAIYSGHSLRAGLVTTSLRHKVDPLTIIKLTRHKKLDTLRIYDRREDELAEHFSKGFL